MLECIRYLGVYIFGQFVGFMFCVVCLGCVRFWVLSLLWWHDWLIGVGVKCRYVVWWIVMVV